MNIWYAIEESPYQWPILAGAFFVSGLVGTMAMIAWGWSPWLARIWFLAGVIATLFCLLRMVLVWKRQVDAAVESEDKAG